jgi:UDP-N-acetylglucosamine--N-acetylmuramyl-(pentapeptide) pyrophosphoryl-undecaprenol N-acetylglucosamine transferase
MDQEIVAPVGIPFESVSAAPLRVNSPLAVVRGLASLLAGTAEAWRLLGRFQPDVVFATGGYASVPVGIAARLRGKPLVVYLPDVRPGWAVSLLARIATRIATTSEPSLRELPEGKAVVTGYPVRPSFWTAGRDESRTRLGLPIDEHVLLVAGASQGARSVNEAVASQVDRLLAVCHVLHVTGRADEEEFVTRRDALPAGQRERYHVLGYIDDMAVAMAASDLAVLRSGASVLGELPASGLPSVLVPGVYEGGYDQRPNARYLADEGAAVVLENTELGRLAEVVRELLADESRRQEMSLALRRLARPDAARRIARVLRDVASEREAA